MPPEVLNLVDYGRIRVMADRLGVESVDRQGSVVVFTFKGQGGPDPQRVITLVRERPEVVLAPPASLKLDLNWASNVRKAAARTAPGVEAQGKGTPGRPAGSGAWRPGPTVRSGPAGRPGGGGQRGVPRESWWAARAREAEVRPGFSKEAILRPEKEDPRGPTGALTRVREVLSALGGSV